MYFGILDFVILGFQILGIDILGFKILGFCILGFWENLKIIKVVFALVRHKKKKRKIPICLPWLNYIKILRL